MKRERIGPKIKKIRKDNALTQKQLADALGYSDKSMITHIEKGDSDMTYEKIMLLLKTYMLDANELFDIEGIDELVNETERVKAKKKNNKAIIYIHGLYGSSEEVRDYSFLTGEFDVIGLDYQDGNPWEVKDAIRAEFKKISKGYDEVVAIANSIGAFYTYQYLSDFDISKAFFISPVADMYQIIFNMMMDNKISKEQLEKEKIIHLKNGQTLSYDFYQYILNNKDNWSVPTFILYGKRDQLVYIESIVDFVARHNATLNIREESEHFFHTEEEKKYIKNWIMKNI